MKRIITIFICILMLGYCLVYYNRLSDSVIDFLFSSIEVPTLEKNEYTRNKDYKFVKTNTEYIAYSYQDIMDIIYTGINYGYDNFSFYCPAEYVDCINDVKDIIADKSLLSHINNFVHPYNSFIGLTASYTESQTSQITLKIEHIYSKEDINIINTKIDEIINEKYNENKSLKDNIKILHDYIINNTRYDTSEFSKDDITSSTAYGLLINHKAKCNGYADTMAIMLTKLGVENYKISTTNEDISYESQGHVWNAIYLDNNWYHLDLTWDDPVSDNGKDYLFYHYFIVTTEQMKEADTGKVELEEHNFNNKIYLEFNPNI